MANAATLTISATVLPDDISKTFSDLTATYTPADSSEGWYYKLTDITTTSRDLIASDEDSGNATFLQMGSTKAMGGVATATAYPAIDGSADQVKFVIIRHLGTTDDGSTATDESIYVGIGVAAAHDTAGCIEIPSGHTWYARWNSLTVSNLHVISGDKDASSAGEGTIQCQVFAILHDV
tara:strand:- start:333 stop:869 length:537 start_codon:yes stop_codon:yes gene_type:complete